MDYSIEQNIKINGRKGEIDIIAYGKVKRYIDVKFYRSKNVSMSTIRKAANDLAYNLTDIRDGRGFLIFNIEIPQKIQSEILSNFDIDIWGIDELLNNFETYSIDLKEEFEKLLLEAQQGTDAVALPTESTPRFPKTEIPITETPEAKPKKPTPPIKDGEVFSNKLKALPCGRADWPAYEQLGLKILQFLFEKTDLSLWEKQARTDDTLSRFDLICRINGFDDFWKALIRSFNTRFVLFEFKNYCDQITQHQIYTTERYLYQKALRSVGFMISRKGGNPGAIQAAKGSLREHGKLILLLSDDDLHEMLRIKDANGNPSDYLSDKLDQWLIALSR